MIRLLVLLGGLFWGSFAVAYEGDSIAHSSGSERYHAPFLPFPSTARHWIPGVSEKKNTVTNPKPSPNQTQKVEHVSSIDQVRQYPWFEFQVKLRSALLDGRDKFNELIQRYSPSLGTSEVFFALVEMCFLYESEVCLSEISLPKDSELDWRRNLYQLLLTTNYDSIFSGLVKLSQTSQDSHLDEILRISQMVSLVYLRTFLNEYTSKLEKQGYWAVFNLTGTNDGDFSVRDALWNAFNNTGNMALITMDGAWSYAFAGTAFQTPPVGYGPTQVQKDYEQTLKSMYRANLEISLLLDLLIEQSTPLHPANIDQVREWTRQAGLMPSRGFIASNGLASILDTGLPKRVFQQKSSGTWMPSLQDLNVYHPYEYIEGGVQGALLELLSVRTFASFMVVQLAIAKILDGAGAAIALGKVTLSQAGKGLTSLPMLGMLARSGLSFGQTARLGSMGSAFFGNYGEKVSWALAFAFGLALHIADGDEVQAIYRLDASLCARQNIQIYQSINVFCSITQHLPPLPEKFDHLIGPSRSDPQ